MCVYAHIHLKQQNKRMCAGAGGNIKKTVHQQYSDEVAHRLSRLQTPECVLTVSHYTRLTNSLEEVTKPVIKIRGIRPVLVL